MKIAIYIGTEKLRREERLESLIDGLEKGGCKVYVLDGKEPLKGKDPIDAYCGMFDTHM